ncbi:MAG: 4Fe-4S binding protein [Archaeoglobaceae archaeon]|nr:4Fe-4S binding protein [Archaeoglobaceae archaeon]MDW8128025.1 4Fe-4S binding protein [Archaeoglobaceae archaeon]
MLLLLRFDAKTVREPIISLTAIKTGALINILKADVGARKGELIVEVPEDKAKEVLEVLKKMGVDIQEITKSIARNDNCVHCGACVSICPTEVFYLNGENKVELRAEKCIHCGACVKVCPTMALYFPI